MKLHSAMWFTILSLARVTFAQEAKPAPPFENVDIHASLPGTQMFGGRFRAGTRFEADGYTMMDLISKAYGLPWDRITGGPAWLGADRFDVLAIVPTGVTSKSAPAMLQALLADRFKLVVHSDTRPVPVHIAVAAKHILLKETAGGESKCNFNTVDSFVSMTCGNTTVDELVRQVADYASEYFDRPLVDKTNLTGRYDFTLRWTPQRNMRLRSSDGEMTGITPQAALEDQLGLKNLTFIAVLFNENSTYVVGKEGQAEFALKEETFNRLTSGLDTKLTLVAPPGKYRLRSVVQEGTEGRLSAASQEVEISQKKTPW